MKKILTILLLICLSISFCACDSSNNAVVNDFRATATENNPTVMGMFYRNVAGHDLTSEDSAIKEVDKKADAMLESIENYSDTVKAGEGKKTYYLSNNGDDKNDGLTPETARKNYFAVKSFLEEGDAVLFQRGDLFREQIQVVSGVSYGAYGEGIKPRIYCSVDGSKNGSGKWEETDTDDVWCFNKVITDYSNMIFNNGEAIGRPVKDFEKITERELNVAYKGGKVYLYCPKGNPADVYKIIEIVEGISCVTGSGQEHKNIHIQNLCIMYGNFGIAGVTNTENFEVDGCIIGYVGGKNLIKGVTSLGNGIELWGNVHNAKIHDNYVFQCFDTGITHQTSSIMEFSVEVDDIYYTDNLIEYCHWSFEGWVPEIGTNSSWDKPEYFEKGYTSRMGEVRIENNICRFAGYGWGTLDRRDASSCDIMYRSFMHDENLVITGNTFDRPRYGVCSFATCAKKDLLEFTNNTILQTKKRQVFNILENEIKTHEDINAYMGKYFSDYLGTTLIEIK